MNYLSFIADRASGLLDSVDEQATEKVKAVQSHIQQGQQQQHGGESGSEASEQRHSCDCVL